MDPRATAPSPAWSGHGSAPARRAPGVPGGVRGVPGGVRHLPRGSCSPSCVGRGASRAPPDRSCVMSRADSVSDGLGAAAPTGFFLLA